MRVLVLHPEDVPWRGEWSATRWDLIVDLGFRPVIAVVATAPVLLLYLAGQRFFIRGLTAGGTKG